MPGFQLPCKMKLFNCRRFKSTDDHWPCEGRGNFAFPLCKDPSKAVLNPAWLLRFNSLNVSVRDIKLNGNVFPLVGCSGYFIH